jgi:hypothetical protein
MLSSLTKIYVFILVLSVIAIGFTSCNDEIYSTNPKDKLSFSTDTLAFDTVFSTIGSVTSKIMIYNRNNYALKISQVALGGGKNSPFRINVDGSTNTDNRFENVEIQAKDSMYVFVAVTINPHDTNSPMFIQDSIIFRTNGVLQQVKLQAYGQDVKIFRKKFIRNDTTLTAEKPYLVYDYVAIDTAKTLTIKPGCKFYFHNNANLIVYGNLKAQGTFEQPIVMRGDRLDNVKFDTPFPYNNVAGQWGGLYLLWNGGTHTLQHVNMNGGYVGVYFSNNDRNIIPNLQISDCRIHNFLLYGLVVQNGNVQVSNSEISNSSSYSVYLSGGKHTFLQSTIANYFDNSSVQPTSRDQKPAVMIMNLNRVAPMETVFRNCIISGNLDNEFTVATRYEDQYPGIFDHCYIRKPAAMNFPTIFKDITGWFGKKDTLFISTRYDYKKNTYFNFMPDSVSPARGFADKNIASQFPLDLNGNNRLTGNKPDIGAYQWQPSKK